MTQHSAASHRARGWKVEAESLRAALELEEARHEETRRDLMLSRAAHDISRAELSDTRDALRVVMRQAAEGSELRHEMIAMLKRHGIEV